MEYCKVFIKYFLFASIIFITGCSSMVTSVEQYKTVDKFVAQENFAEAASTFEKSKNKYFTEKDRVLFWLDLGLLYHYAQKDSNSIKNLQLADFAMEELYTKSISKGVTSMLLNDNALDYSGEDYENFYINVFKALSYYRQGSTDEALVEIRRLLEKFVESEQRYQKEIDVLKDTTANYGKVDEVKINFYSSALSHFISMILFHNDQAYDDARISKEKLYEAFETQKEIYNFDKPNFDTLLSFTGKSKIAFLSFLGKAPVKYDYVFSIDTFKDLIIISIIENGVWVQFSATAWEGIEGGLHTKFAVPKMRKNGSIIDKIEIMVNGKLHSNLSKLESIEDIAFETFKRDEAIIYLKSLTRTITKAIANEAINKELDKQTGGGDFGSLTRLLSGAIINATENADLRISHYFPSFAYAGSIELEPGTYNIEIVYKGINNNVIAIDKFDNYLVTRKKDIDLIETVLLQ